MRDCSASILPLMRASAPLRRLSSASNTAVALGMTTARRQRAAAGSAFGKDVAHRAFQAAHDLLEAAEGDALGTLFETVEGRGREAELFGELGVGHLAAARAQESSELSFQFCWHETEAARDGIPDAE